jgi:hypothetical protein
MATKDFVDFTPSTGSGNSSIDVTASKNVGDARETFLTISGNGVTKKINISQETGVINIIIVGVNGIIAKVEIPK